MGCAMCRGVAEAQRSRGKSAGPDNATKPSGKNGTGSPSSGINHQPSDANDLTSTVVASSPGLTGLHSNDTVDGAVVKSTAAAAAVAGAKHDFNNAAVASSSPDARRGVIHPPDMGTVQTAKAESTQNTVPSPVNGRLSPANSLNPRGASAPSSVPIQDPTSIPRRQAIDLRAAANEPANSLTVKPGENLIAASCPPRTADAEGGKPSASRLVVTPSETSAATSASAPIRPKDLSTSRIRRAVNINDIYTVSKTHVLGTGISGAVKVALHRTTGKKFAIKTLSLTGVSPKKAAMLHNEVAIYLILDHPNIAKLIEVYEEPGVAIHLVMELCTGGELYDRLAAKKKYSEGDAAHVARQMLAAINYCHHHHICHRDLKLENWVYSDASADAPLKLIDFGFSRIFNPGVPMTAMHGTVYYVSPEVMDGCYAEKCDIWSIGVIVYMLLSGAPPFNGNYDHEILVRIKRGAFSFSGPRWAGISDSAKAFVRFLLQRDPDLRPSAEEALQHAWLQPKIDGTEADREIDICVLHSMRNFALGTALRRAALGVVALGMTTREVEELEKAFRKLDKQKKGTIQLQDIAGVLIEKLHIDDEEAQAIFARINQSGSRQVCYSEFIAAALQSKILKDESLIKEAFDRFDVEHRGKISLENMRSVLGDSYNGTRVEEILELCDVDRDGFIDFDEFYNAVTSDEAVLRQQHALEEQRVALENEAAAAAKAAQQSGVLLSDLQDSDSVQPNVAELPASAELTDNNAARQEFVPERRITSTDSHREVVDVLTATSNLEAFYRRQQKSSVAALSVLQTMRKATCLSALGSAEKIWHTEQQSRSLLRRASEGSPLFAPDATDDDLSSDSHNEMRRTSQRKEPVALQTQSKKLCDVVSPESRDSFRNLGPNGRGFSND